MLGTQREVLVDHPQTELVGMARVADDALRPVDEHAAGVRVVIAHEALHQRALAGAVLAEDGVERARGEPQRHVVERDEVAEPLGHADDLDVGRAGGGHVAHRLIVSSLGAPTSTWRGEELQIRSSASST